MIIVFIIISELQQYDSGEKVQIELFVLGKKQ